MASDIDKQLYREFYSNHSGDKEVVQASAHWKKFTQQFNVEYNPDGTIQTIKGYGFGGSDDKRFSARMMASIENSLLQFRLSYPGLSEEKQEAKKLVAEMSLSFSRDAFRQVCTGYFLKKEITKAAVEIKNILVIGDGHGILSALLSEHYPNAKIFLIDLGATLFFQAYYLGKKFKNKPHVLFGNEAGHNPGIGFYYCPAERLQDFPLVEIDLAINIASMQEMNIEVVNNYFSILRERKTKLFYCCNRLEKMLPDGRVTRFYEYAWKKDDKKLVDEKCPWHQFFFARSTNPNLKLFNLIPIPLLHRYDGVHWHRLSLLSH